MKTEGQKLSEDYALRSEAFKKITTSMEDAIFLLEKEAYHAGYTAALGKCLLMESLLHRCKVEVAGQWPGSKLAEDLNQWA